MGYQDMKFEGDYLEREWRSVGPRLAAGETMETISPVKVYRHRSSAREIAHRLGHSGAILEIGCGASLIVHEAAKLGLTCHGVDMNDLVLEYCRALERSYGSGVEFSKLDAFALPFGDGSFDTVFSVGMLEHYSPKDQLALTKECKRVARRFVEIHVPNEGPDSCIHGLIKDHEDSHLPTDLVKLALDAGLTEPVLDGRGLFFTRAMAETNSLAYQQFVRDRFPQFWRELGTADIEALVQAEGEATHEERMRYGSIHYVVARVG